MQGLFYALMPVGVRTYLISDLNLGMRRDVP